MCLKRQISRELGEQLITYKYVKGEKDCHCPQSNSYRLSTSLYDHLSSFVKTTTQCIDDLCAATFDSWNIGAICEKEPQTHTPIS